MDVDESKTWKAGLSEYSSTLSGSALTLPSCTTTVGSFISDDAVQWVDMLPGDNVIDIPDELVLDAAINDNWSVTCNVEFDEIIKGIDTGCQLGLVGLLKICVIFKEEPRLGIGKKLEQLHPIELGVGEVLRQADAAVVASGTATLEAALAGCPTVLVYRVGWLFAFLARRFIKGIRHIGLANIIAEKAGKQCPMPELLQEDFTVEKVLAVLRPLLESEESNAIARALLGETMKLLRSDGGAIARIADRVLG